jgi:hypothetical protein
MKQLQLKIPPTFLFPINKKIYRILSVIMGLLAFSFYVKAQNASYNANTVPIKGTDNSAFGWRALRSNTTGTGNIATGKEALYFNTTGNFNVANGLQALYSNTIGSYNIANGYAALSDNTTGSNNTANGARALASNTVGGNNTASGFQALFSNKSNNNTASGYNALFNNTIGSNNTAMGSVALLKNTTGTFNTAIGVSTLSENTTGYDNTAIGSLSLINNTAGNYNTAIGKYTLLGNTTGSNNTALGYDAGVSAGDLTNATAIGYEATVNASNKIRLGDVNVTLVETQTQYKTVSDGRFKNNISETDVKGLEFIKRLRPVVYNFDTKKFEEFLTKNLPEEIRKKHMSKDFTPSTAIRQSGFIAQEVEKAAREIGYNFDGVHTPESADDNYSLAYGQFVVPLVKAVQEQQQMIEQQQQQINELKKLVAASSGTATIKNSNVELSNNIVLDQNVPNPFANQTTINYTIPQNAGTAQILFYDASGRLIKTSNITNKGKGQLKVFANDLAKGLYSYSLIVDGKTIDAKKMIKQ